jgi:hypothetical protein
MIGKRFAPALLLIGGFVTAAACERTRAAAVTPASEVQSDKPIEPWVPVDESFKGCELG